MENINIWHFPISEQWRRNPELQQSPSFPPCQLGPEPAPLPHMEQPLGHPCQQHLPLGANSCFQWLRTILGRFLCAGTLPTACSRESAPNFRRFFVFCLSPLPLSRAGMWTRTFPFSFQPGTKTFPSTSKLCLSKVSGPAIPTPRWLLEVPC